MTSSEGSKRASTQRGRTNVNEHKRLSFSERNVIRREARAKALLTINRKSLNLARLDRRTRKGKFGLAPNHIFDELALGTTAVTRKNKGD